MRKTLLFLALLVFSYAQLGALEVKAGILKVIIDEGTARVSIYKLIDIAKGRYEPLVFDVDPRTSYATLSFSGKQIHLGDSSEFHFSASKTEAGALLSFRSAYCTVDEELSFVASAGAALPDGLRVRYTLTNVSQKEADIGLRLLCDTWLGEKSGLHFRTDLHPKQASEMAFEGGGPDTWIASSGDKADLMVLLSGGGVTRPDRAILANWKRINDEPWMPEVSPGRSFTLLPYSVNDSALALYWQPIKVQKGESRVIVSLLGCFNAAGYPEEKAGTDPGTAALFSKSVLAGQGASPAEAMAIDLVTVKDLITQIDLSVVGGKPLTAEEVSAWRKILDSLEERKKAY